MITCQDILELQLDGVELIAGEKGLTRPVTWTYMVNMLGLSCRMPISTTCRLSENCGHLIRYVNEEEI